jgi:hypothetical protein
LDLAASGEVDYLMFDRLGELTMTQATLRRIEDPSKGFDRNVAPILCALGDFLGRGGIVVGSFGQANVPAALGEVVSAGRAAGLKGVRIGALHGGDVLDYLKRQNTEIPGLHCRIGDLGDQVICAHAYLGAEGLCQLLSDGAQFIITGRVADPSLAVAIGCDAMGWSQTNWTQAAMATMAGHMLQGGSSITGGGFADPPFREVPGLDALGFPYVVLSDDAVEITKLPQSGGMVTVETVKCRIGYEIGDPSTYLTPDVTLDMSDIDAQSCGQDRVRLTGMSGRERPEMLRVLVGVRRGWKAISEISIGGPGCFERTRLAEQLIRERLKSYCDEIVDMRFDVHGISALFGKLRKAPPELNEIRLRVAAHCKSRAAARTVCDEAGMVYFDRPAGVGGPQARIVEALGVYGVPLEREAASIACEVVEL